MICMFCEACGKQIPDDSNVCQYCGTVLNYSDSANTVNANNSQDKRKINQWKMIVIVAALVAIISIVVSVASCVRNSQVTENQTATETLQSGTEEFETENSGEKVSSNEETDVSVTEIEAETTTKKSETTTKKPQTTETADAVSYIGKTYGDVFKKYGTDFTMEYINGGEFVSYKNVDMLFGVVLYYDHNAPVPSQIKNEKISGIFALGNTRVYKNFFAGMPYSQLIKLMPDIEDDGLYYDNMDEEYNVSFEVDGYRFTYSWFEDPRNGQLSDWVYVVRY